MLNRALNSAVARTLVAVTVGFGLLSAGGGAAAADDVQPNIIGGTAPTANYPPGAMVSLKYDAPTHDRVAWHTCGARKLSGKKLVTAAHCVTNPPALMSTAVLAAKARLFKMDLKSLAIPVEEKSFWVRIGSLNKEQDGLLANVTTIEVHPAWSWTAIAPDPSADIAVLTLDRYVDAYDLPIAPREARPGDEVLRLGWGVTELNGEGPLPSQIRELRSRIVNKAQCEPGVAYGWTPGDVCVSSPNGNGACSGDSGGPIVIKINGAWYDAGITSRSVADHCGMKPDSYTSTPHYQEWVYDTMRGVGAATVVKSAPPVMAHV